MNNKEGYCIKSEKDEDLLSGKKVLVVDDNCIITLYLSHLLSRLGYICIEAQSGLEAVEIIKNEADVAAVLLDLEMPNLDGIETVKIIKELRRNIPVIASTGYNDQYCTNLLLCSGFDDVISKPVEELILVNKIGGALTRYNDI